MCSSDLLKRAVQILSALCAFYCPFCSYIDAPLAISSGGGSGFFLYVSYGVDAGKLYGIPKEVGLVLGEFVEVQSSAGWVAFEEVGGGCVVNPVVLE